MGVISLEFISDGSEPLNINLFVINVVSQSSFGNSKKIAFIYTNIRLYKRDSMKIMCNQRIYIPMCKPKMPVEG